MISKIIELETLTPLFIKGKDLEYGEGMLRGGDGYIYLIDNDRLCEYIAKKNKVDEYAKEFDGRNKKMSIKIFLLNNGIYPNDDELRKISKGITEMSEKARGDDEKKKYNFIQNGKRKPFIPGTSIKGAIRNAILWELLKDKKNKRSLDELIFSQRSGLDNEIQGITLINKALEKAKQKDYESADRIMDELFISSFRKKNKFQNVRDKDGYFNYHNGKNCIDRALHDYQRIFAKCFSSSLFQNNRFIHSLIKLEKIPQAAQDFTYISKKDFNDRWHKAKRNKSLIDFFRIVKISDGNIVQDTSLDWLETQTVCKNNIDQTYKKDHTDILECIPKNIKVSFKITIDTRLAKSFFDERVPVYLQSVENLFDVISEYYEAVADYEEKEYYQEATSIPVDENSSDKEKVKLRVNTTGVLQLYKSKFGLQTHEILFRTGWGGGFMSKTQFLHLDVADRARVRDMIHYNGSNLAPKSRCLIVEGQNATEPLGWCKLRVLGDAKDMPLPSIDTATIKTELITQLNKHKTKDYQIISGKPITEREVQKSNVTAKAILKQAEKKNTNATHIKYKVGQTVYATVEECVPLTSLKVIIGDQVLNINKGVIKQKGETVQIQITEIENGKILAAKLFCCA